MACCPGLGSGYFAILREYLLRNNNQQSNVPREKFEIERTCLKISLCVMIPTMVWPLKNCVEWPGHSFVASNKSL